MKKALTNRTLESLKATGERYAVHDAHCPGLVVRVNASGTKTFAVAYRYGIKQRRLTLGPYPIISLAEARDKAREIFREVLEGVDPQAVRRRKHMNLREGVEAFIEQYSPISGITKMVLRIQAASETFQWRLHDLRRTAASEMARMSIPPHVVEKVLNHVSGTLSGVAGVYNRYGYDPEKRDALEKWGEFLEGLQGRGD